MKILSTLTNHAWIAAFAVALVATAPADVAAQDLSGAVVAEASSGGVVAPVCHRCYEFGSGSNIKHRFGGPCTTFAAASGEADEYVCRECEGVGGNESFSGEIGQLDADEEHDGCHADYSQEGLSCSTHPDCSGGGAELKPEVDAVLWGLGEGVVDESALFALVASSPNLVYRLGADRLELLDCEGELLHAWEGSELLRATFVTR